VLELTDVCKRFGGLVATDRVSLQVREGEVHALIGPNGAGKTTLVNLISGGLDVDAGEIIFEGQKVHKKKQNQRVLGGLARSYQITSIFRGMSVLENLALAVQARSGSSFSFFRPVTQEAPLFEEALAIARDVNLHGKADAKASALSHGEQRALEVGLALATKPRLLLLDEPMAGTGPEESNRMIALIERIRSRVTVLLVEHDMDAVFLLLEEYLASLTAHWMIIFGPFLVLLVLFAQRGIYGLIPERNRRDG
jgi:branched-chain amino acid transport system ATP-binding protein